MGKINKFANLYDRNGKLIRHTDKDGILKNITIPELEKMIDEYPEDGDALALDNMKMALFQMYNKYGDPHREELVKRILEEQAKRTKPEEVTEKLQELNDTLEEEKTDEFEYIEDVENIGSGDGILAQVERDYVINYDPEQHEAKLQKYVNNIQAA